MGQIGKTENRIEYQIRKPVSIFRENRKPNALIRKIRKPQRPPNRKTEVFLAQKPKNRSKKLPKPQNRKSRCPSPLSLPLLSLSTNKMPAPQAMLSQKSLFCGRNSLSIQRRSWGGEARLPRWFNQLLIQKRLPSYVLTFHLNNYLLYFVIVTFLLIDARPVWVNRFYDFIFCTRITPSATKNTV